MVVLNIGKQLFPFPHCDTSFPLSRHHVSFKPEWKQQVVKPHRSYVHYTVVFTLLPTAHARSLNPSLTLALCFLIRFISCWDTHTHPYMYTCKNTQSRKEATMSNLNTQNPQCSVSVVNYAHSPFVDGAITSRPPLWHTLLPVSVVAIGYEYCEW